MDHYLCVEPGDDEEQRGCSMKVSTGWSRAVLMMWPTKCWVWSGRLHRADSVEKA
jgi:hypothetical protein